MSIQIENRVIGKKHEPFIVAEMSGNHNQSLDRALEMVDAAAQAGAHALKLQTYTADTMTLNLEKDDFIVSESNPLWGNQTLYDLYLQAYTPWEWHKPIFDRCHELGMTAFSSPFDETAVDFLESLDVPCYKIASFENIDLPLIRKVAQTGKPIIISTGMATVAEIDEAVNTAKQSGCEDLILLKCTSTYPATPENTNILTIPHMRDTFQCEVGLSDHTLGTGVAVASVALGATIIEKHFTLSRNDGGIDAAFSMEPDELESLVQEAKRSWQSLGTVTYGPTESESDSKKYRRSLYVTEDLKKGDVLTAENLKAIRPGYGLSPKYIDVLLGKQVNQNIKKGTPVTWDLI
ncbi:pseudaminic acid synthase [Tenuibacillus multivorans]|uniref:Pseudaminic acid synthase n=1 Tax=Tenuibacillus multivorans TaxID=237069 RepID=A0A1G9YPF4_9BACI|nr:pseudaminic acid synthase [Tenuibacillus multivorans]GEL78480.1 pseudaminic acid synthase [Tenuibacillus multivorans]SDN10495.1 pseudaminic acid synthase [Tenuibacillus multivorans]